MIHTLDMAVREYLGMAGDTSITPRYRKAYASGVSGLRDMHNDVSGDAKVCVLHLNDTDSAALPPDYIKYTRIFVIGPGNLAIDLGLNENIINPGVVVDSCGNDTRTTIDTNPNLAFGPLANTGVYGSWDSPADNWRNGEFMGRLFGAGGGTNANGYYKVDPAAGLIQFSAVRSRTIVMEYLGDICADYNGDYTIHPFLYEPIKAYIHWGLNKYNLTIGMGAIKAMEMSYLEQKRHATHRFQMQNAAEFVQLLRTNNSPSPKM